MASTYGGRMQSHFGKGCEVMADLGQQRLAPWTLATAIALLAALAAPALAGYLYTRDDLGAFHLPVRAFYAECLNRGEPFDWMPQLYCGFYLTGEGQAGSYHPLHLLWYRFLPLRLAMNVELVASYPAMFVGMFLFLRRWLARTDAAMFGSLLFTFSGFNLLHFVHPNAIAVVAHIPWLLWADDVLLRHPSPRHATAATSAVSLLTGSQLLLGYPQYVWFSLLAEAAYTAFIVWNRGISTPERLPGLSAGSMPRVGQLARRSEDPASVALLNRLARLVMAKLVGLLVGAVQVLPTLDALATSARRVPDARFVNWGSLHPMNLVQMVAPYLFVHRVVGQNTHELAAYFGAVPLALVAWLLANWRRLGPLRRPAGAVLAFGVFALIMALGQYGYLYRLQRLLPLVGTFRFPCRYLVLVQLASAVLAAMSLSVLITPHEPAARDKKCSRGLTALSLVVGTSLTVALAGLIAGDRPFVARPGAVCAGPLLIGSAALLVALASQGVRQAAVGLVLLAAADLGYYGLSYSVFAHADSLESLLANTPTPPAKDQGRILLDTLRFDEPGERTGNQITLLGWHRADGYAGLEPARRLDYRSLAAMRVAGVRWVRRSPATEQIQGLIPENGQWLRVPDPLPHVRLISLALCTDEPAAHVSEIDLQSTALVDEPLYLEGGSAGTVLLESQRPGRLELLVHAPSRQLLVVSESFHPGWEAAVNGRAQPVVRINGDFLGCVVEPGCHRVNLEFRPRSLRYGRAFSLAGFVVAFLLAALPSPARAVRSKEPI